MIVYWLLLKDFSPGFFDALCFFLFQDFKMITVVAQFKEATGFHILVVVSLLLTKFSYVVTKGINCKTGAARTYKVLSSHFPQQTVFPAINTALTYMCSALSMK